MTVDADIDISKKDKYIDTLVTTNMRRDGRDYQGRQDKRMKREMNENVSQSAEHSTASARYSGARPALLKNNPIMCNEPGWRPETFTATELKEGFSGRWDLAYEARVWLYGKFVEDHMQDITDPLFLGIRLHRVAGAGARHSPGDGMPGFLAKTMLTTYRVTNLELDASGKILRLHGVGLDGKLTPAFVWNH